MTTEEIKQLLEKYYNGESSVDEEIILKEFFSREIIPDELKAERDIFSYYLKSSGIPLPSDGFTGRIISSIDKEEINLASFRKRRIFRALTTIAAGILILAGSYLLFKNKSEQADTFSDPEIAYNEAMKILYDVSARLNRGTKGLEKVGMMQDAANESFNILNKPASIVSEKMKSLDMLNDAFSLIGKKQNYTK